MNCKDARKTAHFINSESCCSHTVLPLLSEYCVLLPCCRASRKSVHPAVDAYQTIPEFHAPRRALNASRVKRCLIRPGCLRRLHLHAGPSGFRAQAFFRVCSMESQLASNPAPASSFTAEQKEYLKGFFDGLCPARPGSICRAYDLRPDHQRPRLRKREHGCGGAVLQHSGL